jgi:hypothetical protein
MNDEFEIDNVETASWEDLFNGEWERKNRPFQYFVNYKIFKGKGILGYGAYHVIFQFPEFLWNRLDDFLRKTKWAYQRAYRGWDDTVVWSVDVWLGEIMPDILNRFKESKGVPNSFFNDPFNNASDEEWRKARMLWDAELDRMIAGFLSGKKISDGDWKDKQEKEELEKRFKSGMESFTKHYFDLWD